MPECSRHHSIAGNAIKCIADKRLLTAGPLPCAVCRVPRAVGLGSLAPSRWASSRREARATDVRHALPARSRGVLAPLPRPPCIRDFARESSRHRSTACRARSSRHGQRCCMPSAVPLALRQHCLYAESVGEVASNYSSVAAARRSPSVRVLPRASRRVPQQLIPRSRTLFCRQVFTVAGDAGNAGGESGQLVWRTCKGRARSRCIVGVCPSTHRPSAGVGREGR